jgi:serine/threonine protein kinase/ABC-type Fe3+ transport system substrate-binding protein
MPESPEVPRCPKCGQPQAADHASKCPGVGPGSTIDGRYVLEMLLGKGGMGVVFRAQQTSVHRPVAIKMLHPSLASSSQFFERFRREAESASRLHHPHIISVYDFGQTADGACYYVMEMLEGENLRHKVRSEGAFSLARTLKITDQIARALGHAHAGGIIHRDLKPQNVMCSIIDGQDFVKVLDFGLVKMMEENLGEGEEGLTTTGQVLGTPQYMAPEQAAGDQVDQRADLYSLGVVTYFMLGGATPYGQKTAHGALKAAATEPLPTISSKRPGAPLPDSVEAFLKRALSYEREGRPNTAEEYMEEFRGAVAGLPADLMEQRPPQGPQTPDAQGSGSQRTVNSRGANVVSKVSNVVVNVPVKAQDGSAGRAPTAGGPAAPHGRRTAVIAGACILALGAIGGGWALFGKRGDRPPGSESSPSTAPTVAPIAAGGPAPAVEIEFEYSTEKKRWVDAQIAAFMKVHPEISVKLIGRGSMEAEEDVVSGKDKPTLWSPADSLALSLAASDWQKKNNSPLFAPDGTDDAPQSLVMTPLVLVVWGDRAAALRKSAKGEITWRSIHDAAANSKGWAGVGGKADWGPVKFGHTNPTRSNSGLQALLMMTLDYFHKSSGLTAADLDNAGYRKWLKEIEGGAPKTESSTGVFMTDMVRYGPSRFDIAVVYESLAIDEIENAEHRWGAIEAVYPPLTAWSDHPVALLQGSWVTEPQRKAARLLIAFLRSAEAQQQALAFGFRPAAPDIQIVNSDLKNPFTRLASQGVKVNLPSAIAPPDPSVIRELLGIWSQVNAGK